MRNWSICLIGKKKHIILYKKKFFTGTLHISDSKYQRCQFCKPYLLLKYSKMCMVIFLPNPSKVLWLQFHAKELFSNGKATKIMIQDELNLWLKFRVRKSGKLRISDQVNPDFLKKNFFCREIQKCGSTRPTEQSFTRISVI